MTTPRNGIQCPGFKAAGLAAGLKKNGKQDLGLIFSEVPASVAGVFTTNRVKAAPVRLDMERVAGGKAQAVIVNSGNANCCVGESGLSAAMAMCRAAAAGLGIAENLVLAASTGVIGEPLPVEKIVAAAPRLVEALSAEGFADLAEAIMTTDTAPKTVARRAAINGKTVTVVGVAKGAGMIRPDMATLLCFVCTDAEGQPAVLRRCLTMACDKSFNCITVDGDTSTNDTLLLLANGLSGASLAEAKAQATFQEMLDDTLTTLAKMLVRDAEGATKLVEIVVKGAASDADARRVADTVANSNLVKTALFGEDANWGRILAAAGRSGAELAPERIDVFFGAVRICQDGQGCGKAAEAEATRVLKTAEFAITLDLKLGSGRAAVWTCDFSLDYVRINADYRS
jgi:glutamate N-acetyltransferase / amino-acid N-acetyltransferase